MKNQYTSLMFLLLSISLNAQERVTVNQGDLSVVSGTEISTYMPFINKNTGNVISDGDFYFYDDYHNDGLFSYSTNQTTGRSEEHTSELQSRENLVCRLLLEKKKKKH